MQAELPSLRAVPSIESSPDCDVIGVFDGLNATSCSFYSSQGASWTRRHQDLDGEPSFSALTPGVPVMQDGLTRRSTTATSASLTTCLPSSPSSTRSRWRRSTCACVYYCVLRVVLAVGVTATALTHPCRSPRSSPDQSGLGAAQPRLHRRHGRRLGGREPPDGSSGRRRRTAGRRAVLGLRHPARAGQGSARLATDPDTSRLTSASDVTH